MKYATIVVLVDMVKFFADKMFGLRPTLSFAIMCSALAILWFFANTVRTTVKEAFEKDWERTAQEEREGESEGVPLTIHKSAT
jgi:hypothetical protein